MTAKQIGSLIKGILFEEGAKYGQQLINKAYDYLVPDKFSDGFTKFQNGNVQKDNWGTFGTFLAKTAYDVITAPLEKTNSALPPTTGTVTKFAPALPSQPPVQVINTKSRSVPVKRPVKMITSNTVPVIKKKSSTKRKNVSEKMTPKRKKQYTYRVNI